MGRTIWFSQILCLLLVFLLFHFHVNSSLSFPSSSPSSAPLCLLEESSALLQFKSTLSLDSAPFYCDDLTSYPKTNSWNRSTNCCTWEGVTCDKVTGHVIGLDLGCSLLVGSLPVNSTLFLLKGLQRLNLAHNNLTGSIVLFRQLVSLTHLNFSFCNFSGLVPSEVSLLSKLVSLDLSHNHDLTFDKHSFDLLARNLSEIRNLFLDGICMSGVAPISLLNLTSSLNQLSLSSCGLHGEFFSEVFQLPYLDYLDLSFNSYIIGYLPKSNWNSPLRFLDLQGCGFRGSIPPSLGNLTKITVLDLSNNNFEGQFPIVLGNLTKITHLDFLYNRFEGLLPAHVSGLQNLEDLRLNDNLISGAVPSWLFTVPSLQYLDLSNNKLTGPIDHIQRPNPLQHIYLGNNSIHGSIPSSFFDLSSLTGLDLSLNNLSGSIKSDMLSKLKNLVRLDLSNNSLLSLSGHGSDVNYSFPQLETVSFSSCNIRRFPSFLRKGKSLRDLDLSFNKISGSISKWESEGWEQLTSLDLSYNLLTSVEQVPGKHLETLDLRSNQLQGPLLAPPPSLREFYISKNKLTGKIPPLLCNLSSLEILDLSENTLGGVIPTCLGNFSSFLATLNLHMNNFHGEIPYFSAFHSENPFSYIRTDNGLINLSLNDNQLEGLLPRSLVNCTHLKVLNLANNKLRDTFPHWLGKLSLEVLILRSNRFRGLLDNAIGVSFISNFTNLQIIDLSDNELTGPLPTKFFQYLMAIRAVRDVDIMPRHVTYYALQKGQAVPFVREDYDRDPVNVTMKKLELELALSKTLSRFTLIDFSKNQFHGQIPQVLGELYSLMVLNLSHNYLTGPIPPSFGNMGALESLDLSSNKLTGRIPSQLTNLTFLEVLNLSENNLVGPIPAGKQFNTFENDSYTGNVGLCGFPLSKQCGNHEGQKPPVAKSLEDEGSSIPFIWKVVMMGYGCGVVLGLSMGYIVFTTGRPWWFVRMVDGDWQENVNEWIGRDKRRKKKLLKKRQK